MGSLAATFGNYLGHGALLQLKAQARYGGPGSGMILEWGVGMVGLDGWTQTTCQHFFPGTAVDR